MNLQMTLMAILMPEHWTHINSIQIYESTEIFTIRARSTFQVTIAVYPLVYRRCAQSYRFIHRIRNFIAGHGWRHIAGCDDSAVLAPLAIDSS
jgi:hypothetical protein